MTVPSKVDSKASAGPQHEPEVEAAHARRPLTPAAQRALAEAEARRKEAEAREKAAGSGDQREVGGQEGPDPVRYGDWEKGGICWDF